MNGAEHVPRKEEVPVVKCRSKLVLEVQPPLSHTAGYELLGFNTTQRGGDVLKLSHNDLHNTIERKNLSLRIIATIMVEMIYEVG